MGYYQRIFPADSETSRFIIQKDPMNGEWSLIEIENSTQQKIIVSFPKENENPIRDAIILKAFTMVIEEAKEMKKQMLNLEKNSKSKDEEIITLSNEKESIKLIEKTKLSELKKKFEQERINLKKNKGRNNI